MAIHAPITGAPLRATPVSPYSKLSARERERLLWPLLASAPRAELEQWAQQIIDWIDAEDGDCDLEDDDPAGGAIDDMLAGDGVELLPLRPAYAIDQSKGPTNEAAALRERYRRICES